MLASVAVPSLLSVRVTPAGRVEVVLIAGVGPPVVVTVNDPGVPAVNVAELALVMAGACWTVTVSVWVIVPYGLAAVRVTGYVPAVVGVPARVPVPSLLSVKVAPVGRPDAAKAGAG